MTHDVAQLIIGFYWSIFVGLPLDILSFLPSRFGKFFRKYSDKERAMYNELIAKGNKFLEERPIR